MEATPGWFPLVALVTLPFASLAEPALHAQDTSSSTDAQKAAYRSSVAQESIRQQADQVQAEIAQLSRELQINGLDPAELTVLNSAASDLKNLSAEEMQKVVNALQSASLATGDHDRQKSMVTAYKGQESISLQLKSLASAIAAEQEQREIPARLEELIARQSANLRQTTTLGASAPDQLSAAQKSTHEVVTSEQQSIAGEIDILQKIVSAKPAVDPAATAFNPASDVLKALSSGTLQNAAIQASQATSAGPFPDAVTQQTAVRDQLTSLLRVALSKLDVATRLQQAKELLDQVLNDQNGLNSVEQQAQLDAATLASRQSGLEDRTAVINALLKPINQAASTQLDLTQHDMGDVSTTLIAAHNPADAAPKQQIVLTDLTKAESLLDQQIAAAQKEESSSPVDKLAALQQLKASIDGAQKDPQASAADLQKLGEQAAPLSPSAANSIANAADQAAKSQPDATAINQSLAQASAEVQKEEDALAQTAQQYQALANASSALSQAQQQSQDANQAIQSTPGNLTNAAHDLSQAANAVAQAQQAAQQDAQDAQAQAAQAQTARQQGDPNSQQQNAAQSGPQTAQQSNGPGGAQPPSPPAGGGSSPTTPAGGSGAQQALQQAANALKSATNQAVQGQGSQAQGTNNQALAAMQSAQAQLQSAMAQLAQAADSGSASDPGQGPGQGQGQGMNTGGGVATGIGQDGQGAISGGAGVYAGPGQVVGSLKPKDRAAIAQYQAEKSPPGYAPEIQQYLKNLADDAAASGAR